MNIISIEGVDGSGKSTIAKLLFERLRNELSDQLELHFSHEPFYFTDEIYNSNDSGYLLLMFLASRKKLINSIDFNQKKLIIFDRYIDSTVVYQILFQKVMDLNTFLDFHEKVVFKGNKDFYPKLTFILEANLEDLKKRISQRKDKKLFDSHDLEFIQNLYRKLPFIFSNRLFYFFNTSLYSVNELLDQMIKIIKSKILFRV